MLRSMTALALTVLSAAVALSAPASAIEIRKEPQLYTVTPAMMHAIDTIVAEKVRMNHTRHRGH